MPQHNQIILHKINYSTLKTVKYIDFTIAQPIDIAVIPDNAFKELSFKQLTDIQLDQNKSITLKLKNVPSLIFEFIIFSTDFITKEQIIGLNESDPEKIRLITIKQIQLI